MLAGSESSSVVCFDPAVLALFGSIVWFVLGVLLSHVPVGLESVTVNKCDSTVLAICVFAREDCVGGLGCVPGTPVLWKEVCETACSGVGVSYCVFS